MSGVELESVRKVYPNGRAAIAAASFAIEPGELIVFVGPSGCGKTTLLRMIAGLEEITSGTLRIAGRVVNDLPPKDRDIAMVFQNYALYPHMSVAENMGFGLKLRGAPRADIERKVQAAAETLGLGAVLQSRPGQLSGGQQQRVALGRALVREPKVFLLDEPLSNLDAKMRLSMRVEIARLHRRLGTTMIYVTHDQIEAMTLADRLIVMHQGRAAQIAPPVEVFAHPADTYVAGFIGEPAMNFCAARLGPEGRSARLDAGPEIALPAGSWGREGAGVTIGIRPQHVTLSTSADALRVAIDLVEPLGSETLLHIRLGEDEIVAKVGAGVSIDAGERVRLRLSGAGVHLFDAQTEQAVA